jgi:hypothetical protein
MTSKTESPSIAVRMQGWIDGLNRNEHPSTWVASELMKEAMAEFSWLHVRNADLQRELDSVTKDRDHQYRQMIATSGDYDTVADSLEALFNRLCAAMPEWVIANADVCDPARDAITVALTVHEEPPECPRCGVSHYPRCPVEEEPKHG